MKPKLLRALIILIILWLSCLTWYTYNYIHYWQDTAYEAEAALSAAQNKTLRYARELRAVERKERIVAIGRDLQPEPDTLDSLGGE